VDDDENFVALSSAMFPTQLFCIGYYLSLLFVLGYSFVAKFPFAKIISPFPCPNTMYRDLNRPVLFT